MGTLAAVAVGSNLGDRAGTIALAIEALAETDGVTLLAASTLHETAPVGGPPQGRFLNGALLLETTLEPLVLLGRLHEIERSFGRIRADGVPNGPRTLDLDLLIQGDLLLRTPQIELPHPRLHERAFVLDPLVEIAPDLEHPGCSRSIRQLHDALHRMAGETTS